jgi:hypothetical protein
MPLNQPADTKRKAGGPGSPNPPARRNEGEKMRLPLINEVPEIPEVPEDLCYESRALA